MKKSILFFALLSGGFVFSQVPCVGGMAGSYPCNGFDLQSQITLSEMSAGSVNDSWGWTDPQDGTEYAIVGLNNGTAFIDISDPVNPVYLGKLPTHTSSSTWRDVKVYNNHAFVVSEAGGHGMQVFDLTRLRNVVSPPETFTEDAHFDGFGDSHNVVINENVGYAYPVRTNVYGGSHFINIQDPVNPVEEGGISGFTHDGQVVTYNGPDTDYTGREIFISCNGFDGNVTIIDVTVKSNPQIITTFDYTSNSHAHQGWLTEDHRYFIMGDESDELDFGNNTRTIIFDLMDLDNPVEFSDYFSNNSAVDHNGYVVGDTYYLASYSAGMRVIDISDIGNGNLTEIGYFDSHPSNNNANYSGAWSVYPYFESGNIVISDQGNGFLLVKSSILSTGDSTDTSLSVYPNPATDKLFIKSKNNLTISEIEIIDMLGKTLYYSNTGNETQTTIDISSFSKGVYFVNINNQVTKKIIKN